MKSVNGRIKNYENSALALFNRCKGISGIDWNTTMQQIKDSQDRITILKEEPHSLILEVECFDVKTIVLLSYGNDDTIVSGKAWINFRKNFEFVQFEKLNDHISEILGKPDLKNDSEGKVLHRRIWQGPDSVIDHRVEKNQAEIDHFIIFTRRCNVFCVSRFFRSCSIC